MVRVRFAPSPTGELHIGGARTALFNYIFARKNDGKFILRIEDTDVSRSKIEWAEGIQKSLSYLGINWDEGPNVGGEFGPYFQSLRKDIYLKFVEKLINEDKAYYCFCSQEDIEKEREQAIKNKVSYRYSKKCRNISIEDAKKRLLNNEKAVVRIKANQNEKIIVNDIIRGKVEFDGSEVDDFIILKSDGNPTYNFVCVIDDHLMNITHVIRAEEHLSNTPKQIYLYNLLGFKIPEFAHVPMILAPDRSKLSKRHGATSVEEFIDKGYLKEALINYLLLLGWSIGEDRTIISLEEAIESFDLQKVSKNAAIYDINKLTWINGYYLKQLEIDELFERMKPFFIKNNIDISKFETSYIKSVLLLVREKVKTLVELVEASRYFFENSFEYEQKGIEKYFTNDKLLMLKNIIPLLNQINDFNRDKIEKVIRNYADSLGVKAAEIIHPTRLAITGRTVTPGLFEIMELLGKDMVISRINRAIEKFYKE
ncbi:glutamate--tRNA ligase [Caldicellulosiruptoraceae bacterium PP1]